MLFRSRSALAALLAVGLLAGLVGCGGARDSDTRPQPAPSTSQEPPTATLRGTVLLKEAWPPELELGWCDYAADQMQCLVRQATKEDKLWNGKTFPLPEGPGGGYDDLHDGTGVTIRDGSGTVIATGALSGGTLTYDGSTFDFVVEEIPAEEDFYQVEVASRGAITYSAADLESSDWQVALALGGGS